MSVRCVREGADGRGEGRMSVKCGRKHTDGRGGVSVTLLTWHLQGCIKLHLCSGAVPPR